MTSNDYSWQAGQIRINRSHILPDRKFPSIILWLCKLTIIITKIQLERKDWAVLRNNQARSQVIMEFGPPLYTLQDYCFTLVWEKKNFILFYNWKGWFLILKYQQFEIIFKENKNWSKSVIINHSSIIISQKVAMEMQLQCLHVFAFPNSQEEFVKLSLNVEDKYEWPFAENLKFTKPTKFKKWK